MRASRIVGWKKTREFLYPTTTEVFEETNPVRLLEWYRFLDDPKDDEQRSIFQLIKTKVEALWND